MTNIKHHDEAKDIMKALYNKSKRFYSKKNRLYKQALYFSPFYRDFILKIIKNSCLNIKQTCCGGRYISLGYEYKDKLSKRTKGAIEVDITDVDVLPHELGHAVDFWFGNKQTLTSRVVLSNGKTLREIFDEEFEKKYSDVLSDVMDEYAFIINTHIQQDAFDILIHNMNKYKELGKTADPNQRQRLQQELYKAGFVEVYYQLYTKKWYTLMGDKYGPIIDALTSGVDLDEFFLVGHGVGYYRKRKARAVEEFFANLFGAKVTSEHVKFKELRRLLPESFAGFEELFYMFYDRIQNNKRFTDVIIRREVEAKQNEL